MTLDKFHKHEVLDRLHLQMEYLDLFVLNHPYTEKYADVQDKLKLAMDCLEEAYQLVGNDNSFED